MGFIHHFGKFNVKIGPLHARSVIMCSWKTARIHGLAQGEIYSDLAVKTGIRTGRQYRFTKNTLTSNRTYAYEIHHSERKSHLFKVHSFQNVASERLTLVYRASTQLFIRFVPVFGATQYNIVARNTEAGPFKGTCHTSTYMCDIQPTLLNITSLNRTFS